MNFEKLLNNSLFLNCNKESIKNILSLDKIMEKSYKKDSIIVQEGDECKFISFIIEGCIYISEISKDGDILHIKQYAQNEPFGCALYKAKRKGYPFTLIACEDSKLIHIPFEQIELLIKHDETFRNNFISCISDNIFVLRDKIKVLSQKDIRSKLLLYLSSNEKNGMTKINHTKTELSKILGIARGSISRELKKMEEENIISFIDKNKIKILNYNLYP